MNGAILLLGRMPSSCADCPLFYYDQDMGVCGPQNIDIDDEYKGRDIQCPLIGIPDSMAVCFERVK